MSRTTFPIITALAFLICNAAPAQKWNNADLDRLSTERRVAALKELRELLSIPNNALYADHVSKNVAWCVEAFNKRGFTSKVLPTDGGPPIVVAELEAPNPDKTVLFYLQIDGQPVDTSEWHQESPYTPELKQRAENGAWEIIDWKNIDSGWNDDWRVFARSASDAKGPVAMFLTAMDIMNTENRRPSYNIKVIMDFEEELGSPHLPAAVKTYNEELAADMFVILDGPRHISNEPTLSFGARGITTLTLTVFGPRAAQHSGHYGNYAPNPALKLAKLLASMKDDDGRVTIPGYYDGISISDETKRILRGVPDDEDDIRRKIGIADIDKVAENYQESMQYPSLNIRGMSSGWVGEEVRTIVPSHAIAEIDIRLVMETESDRLVNLVKEHIKNEGYHFVEGEPTDEERAQHPNLISFEYENSYKAFRTEFDSDIGIWLYDAMKRAFGKEPIRKRTSGGSIPIAPFVTTLGVPAVAVPTVNSDNNQHSPNENLRLGNLVSGIRTCLAILSQ